MDTVQFSIWERVIFRKVKEIKDLSGDVVLYAAQSNPPIDAEIAEKGGFRTKTKSDWTPYLACAIEESLFQNAVFKARNSCRSCCIACFKDIPPGSMRPGRQ